MRALLKKIINYTISVFLIILIINLLLSFNSVTTSQQSLEEVKNEVAALEEKNKELRLEYQRISSDEYLREKVIEEFGTNKDRKPHGADYSTENNNFETKDIKEEKKSNVEKWLEYMNFDFIL